jgi:hypothetical protein
MVASDSDEQLSARLDSALRTGLESDQVDVAQLLSGSRSRARQLRTQRFGLVVAAVVLVVALPVGLQVARPRIGAEQGPSAVMVHSPHPTVHPAPSPVSKDDTGATGGGTAASHPGNEPPGAQLEARAWDLLPANLTIRSSRDLSATTVAIVGGLRCPSVNQAARQAGLADASQWIWGPAKKARQAGFTVTLSYTTWATGQAGSAFVAQTHGGGGCHWSAPQVRVLLDEPLAGDAWAATSSSNGVDAVRIALRINDDIVGVEVQGGDTAAALSLAKQVAHAEAEEMAAPRPSTGT